MTYLLMLLYIELLLTRIVVIKQMFKYWFDQRIIVYFLTVGHSRARTIQDHHFQLLPRRSRHHRCLRLHRSRVFQQPETVARGNRPLRVWKRQQTVSGEQVRPYVKKGCRPANSQGMCKLVWVKHFTGCLWSLFSIYLC